MTADSNRESAISPVVDWTQFRETLAADQAMLLDGRVKGFPLARTATPLGVLGGLGLNVLREDLPEIVTERVAGVVTRAA